MDVDHPLEPRSRASLDLAVLARFLRRRFGIGAPLGYIRGKTAFRDAIMDKLRLSAVEAELLVERMRARGFLRYLGDPRRREPEPQVWRIEPHPFSVV